MPKWIWQADGSVEVDGKLFKMLPAKVDELLSFRVMVNREREAFTVLTHALSALRTGQSGYKDAYQKTKDLLFEIDRAAEQGWLAAKAVEVFFEPATLSAAMESEPESLLQLVTEFNERKIEKA
jgi:hypothetical protein